MKSSYKEGCEFTYNVYLRHTVVNQEEKIFTNNENQIVNSNKLITGIVGDVYSQFGAKLYLIFLDLSHF